MAPGGGPVKVPSAANAGCDVYQWRPQAGRCRSIAARTDIQAIACEQVFCQGKISLARIDKKKLIDAHDFIDMVQKNPTLNVESLRALGDLVYSGGDEIVEMVRKVRAGEKLSL